MIISQWTFYIVHIRYSFTKDEKYVIATSLNAKVWESRDTCQASK